MLKVAVIIAATFSFNHVPAQIRDPEKVLIAYLSRTNNTKAIAEIIHGYALTFCRSIFLQIPTNAQ
jgi:hypothetical protein